MDPQVKVENEKLICLKYNHNKKVLLIVTDDQVPFSDRFLCSQCMETHQNVYTKLMPINSAIAQIKERIAKQNQYEEEQREKSFNKIKQFSQQIIEVQSKIVKIFNEIQRINQLWIADLQNTKKQDDLVSIISEFEYFNSNTEQMEQNNNNSKQNNKNYFIKLATMYKKLLDVQDYEKCYSILKKTIQEEKIIKIKEINQKELQIQQSVPQQTQVKQIKVNNKISVDGVKQIQSIKLYWTYAMAFNNTGNIMVSGWDNLLKVWKFQNEKLSELQTLTGHNGKVFCIVFSQKSNLFVSGSEDRTIKCWRENNEQWICTNTASQHTDYVVCLIMNRNEDQLVSCSFDQIIIVWKIDSFKLDYNYALIKHTNKVYSISLNESETALVSCSLDKSIILWVKDKYDEWKYQHHITFDDYGYRICFIDNNSIIWQQCHKGITHLFQIVNGKLTPKPEFNLELNQETNDVWLFPTIFNKQKQIIIQKHNNYIYILNRQQDGKLQLSYQPLDQGHYLNYGTLSNDGQYLTTWNNGNEQLRVYKLIFK